MNPNSGRPYHTDGHLTTDDVGIHWVQHSEDATSTSSIVAALESNETAIFADTLPPGTIFHASITSGARPGDPVW